MDAREHRKTHDVKQAEKMIPLITGEVAFRLHVCELVFGVDIFDLDFCQIANQAQLCGFGTRVSSSDFCL